MIKEIKANARVSFKQQTMSGDVFYTFDYGETWENDFETQEQYEQKKQQLWDVVNNEINKQIIEIKNMYNKPKQSSVQG